MMSRMPLLATMLVLAPAVARAEPAEEPPPKLAMLVGAGLRHAWLHNDSVYPSSQDQTLGALVATIAYRMSSHVAFGVHAGASRSGDSSQVNGNTSAENQGWNVVAVDVAIALQYEEDRFAVTPWFGRHFSRLHEEDTLCSFRNQVRTCTASDVTRWTSDFTSYGLTASVVLASRVPVAVFVDLQTGSGGAVLGPEGQPVYHYSAATLGVAYRR